ncbi:MAG: ftsK, partial [Paenibacillus sp.]|nr:ftsK [Paenibacillus sp.]
MAKRRRKSVSLTSQLKYELYGILILIFSVIALSHEGPVGRSLMYLFRFFIGVLDWVVPVIFIYIGLYVMIRRGWPTSWTTRKSGILLIVLGFLIMNHITMFQLSDQNGEWTSASWIISQTWASLSGGLNPHNAQMLSNSVGGGMIGAILYACLYFLFDNLGARLIEYTLFAIGFILVTGWSYVDMASKLKLLFRGGKVPLKDTWTQLVHLMKGPGKPKPVRTRNAVHQQVALDDDFEDELTPPVVQREKKKPVFFQLLQKKHKPDHADDDELESDDDPSSETAITESRQDTAERDEEESELPRIRDFQEHIEAVEEVNPLQAPQETAVVAKPQQEPLMTQTFQSPSSQMKIKLPVDGEGELDVTFAQQPERLPAKPYVLPSFTLLAKPGITAKGGDAVDYKSIARKLETTLESFGVRTKVLDIVRGPTVTRYEIQPDVGVKVSRVVSLTDDIALALAAKDIRMEAPIPGKAAIGIEVPNAEVAVVTMREVMESSVFQESSSKLSIAFGRDISGQSIVGNLAKMPHLLVAGATGSGKSVCINGIITSILYKAKP